MPLRGFFVALERGLGRETCGQNSVHHYRYCLCVLVGELPINLEGRNSHLKDDVAGRDNATKTGGDSVTGRARFNGVVEHLQSE